MTTEAVAPAIPERRLLVSNHAGKYVFTLPYINGYSRSSDHEYRLMPNGTVLEEFKHYSTSREPVIELWRLVARPVAVRCQDESKGLPDMDYAEWQRRCRELAPTVPVEVPGGEPELRHATLAEELAYRDIRNGWYVIHEGAWEYQTTLVVDVIEAVTAPNEYIVPVRHLGEDFTSGFAVYRRREFMIDHFKQWMQKMGFTDVSGSFGPSKVAKTFKVNDWTHKSEIELVVDGHTIFSGVVKDFRDLLDACVTKQAEDRSRIEREVGLLLSSRATGVSVLGLKAKLVRALNLAAKIQPMKVSTGDKRELMDYLRLEIEKCNDLDALQRDDDLSPTLAREA